VVVGAPSLAQHLPTGPVLVINATGSRLDALRSSSNDQDVTCIEAVLAEQADEPVLWHRYSDSRLDGVMAAEQWQTVFPNVTEQDRLSLPGQRLDCLLEGWLAQRQPDGPSAPQLQVVLRQGNALAALASLGLWERRLQRVALVGPGANELWGSGVEAWLLPRGFVADADQPLTWERDPLASCRLECEALTQERDGLQQRVEELENRLAQINRELDEIIALLNSAGPLAAPTAEVPG
jgi:hypothetical protein